MYERKKRPPTKKALQIQPIPAPVSDEEAEKLGVNLATKLAIQQLQDGTASSQIITHFLKLGSLKEQAELAKIQKEIILLDAKTKAIQAQELQDKKYQEVIDAIASYTGKNNEWEEVSDDY